MKCLINCKNLRTDWTRKYFYGLPAHMLRIANKPLLEYLVEFCVLQGVSEIRIIMEDPETMIEDYFKEGSRWNLKITFGTSREGESMDKILERNRLLFSGDDLLIADGFFFLHYDKKLETSKMFTKENASRLATADGDGMYFLRRKEIHQVWDKLDFKDYDGDDIRVSSIASVKELFDLNMAMVDGGADNYIMPSYNNEDGVFIGQNVEIMQECDVAKPVILGSNIQLKNFSTIGPGAIVGDNCLVDSNTVVENSVIYGDSYIGSELEIRNKIIYRRRLIDPESGEVLDIVDNFLVSEINSHFLREFLLTAVHFVAALVLAVCQLPLYILLRLFVGAPDQVCECWSDKSGNEKVELKLYSRHGRGFVRKLFMKFSLDKFHLVIGSMLGRLNLVGSRPALATEENLHFINQMSVYRPAVFSYSGMLEHEGNDFQSRIDELYYSHHSSIILDIRIIVQSLVSSLFRHFNVNDGEGE